MSSIVLELQEQVLSGKVSITNLLRKALVVADKLDLKEFKKWIEHELNGYPDISDIPDYRKIKGAVKAMNAVRGWIPVEFGHDDIEATVATNPFGQSVSQLESVLEERSSAKSISIPMTAVGNKMLNELSGDHREIVFATFFQYPQISGIIETHSCPK
jgi:hypothetical protein